MTWEFSHTKNGVPQYDCRAESSWDSETFARYVEHCEKIGYFEYWKHEDGSQMTPEEVYDEIMKIHIPAWSLHRLLSLLPKYIRVRKESFGRFKWTTLELMIDAEFVVWYREDIDNSEVDENFYAEDIYTSLCDCIEWLIKEGYFNKEYLV